MFVLPRPTQPTLYPSGMQMRDSRFDLYSYAVSCRCPLYRQVYIPAGICTGGRFEKNAMLINRRTRWCFHESSGEILAAKARVVSRTHLCFAGDAGIYQDFFAEAGTGFDEWGKTRVLCLLFILIRMSSFYLACVDRYGS